MYEIVKRKEIAKDIILNEIKAADIAMKANPGQFVLVKANEHGERVPFTIAISDKKKGTITIIYMVIGKSTMIFSSLKEGDYFEDVIGPLGMATHLEKLERVVCVGGGTGIAVLYPLAKGFVEKGSNVDVILGARNKELLILKDEMDEIAKNLIICTDDGSLGRKGFVTEALKDELEKGKVDLVIAVGPVMMMKAVSELTKKYKTKTLVSLNPIMIDGTGMCGCCRVSVGGKTKFACVDGPEFDGHEVDFNELQMRLTAYKDKEKKACEDYKCKVREQGDNK
ncbi:MAG: sulfide/dihydroorotate dehydrogenase-like FAD/NAD-binding protein [Desulforegulaceae bacterium]|nr:sulfide/dihydroorotate dehydrogenase-like FAD/NAD-binding protein [Desulforegulaceae bacterium]